MNEAQTRIIKKYPNRRLYDTAVSSYITLEDVKRLVQDHVAIQIIDARTKDDITHNTLLQIIVEQESSTASLLNCDILQKMIRFYQGSTSGTLHQLVTQTFEKTVGFLAEQQSSFAQEFAQGASETEQQMVSELTPELMAKQAAGLEQLEGQWEHVLHASLKVEEIQEEVENIRSGS